MTSEYKYLCIDLKSFYASVECVARGLDPLTTNLVVADPERTEKTICLAVSPSMKKLGVRNRCRVFEIPPGIDYIMAVPRMQLYIDTSANIYSIYLRYISKDDIHVYSIDEAFLHIEDYLALYETDEMGLAKLIVDTIYRETGITATCGIGTNMYLAKIAMDITAKHDESHIGILNEASFIKTLWNHRPLTDFWRIGPGTQSKLAKYGINDMQGIATADEGFLYKLFGIDAELLIDHAWGRESTTIKDIKNYKPSNHSLSNGQVLPCDYSLEDGCIVAKEMADQLCLDLVAQELVTESISISIGYSNALGINFSNGMADMAYATSSAKLIIPTVEKLYRKIVRVPNGIRRINITFNNVTDMGCCQYDFFTTPEELEKERRIQKASIDIRSRFGKNAIVRGMDLQENATTIERNMQIGGHKA